MLVTAFIPPRRCRKLLAWESSKLKLTVRVLPDIVLDDVIARDGVIQVPARVLIPSRSEQQHASAAQDPFHMLGEQREKRWEQVQEEDKEMTVEELKELLEPFL